MQWFKHSTGSHDDPDIYTAEKKFGDAGYTIFFKILEIYGEEFKNINKKGFLKLDISFLEYKLRRSYEDFASILQFFSSRKRIFFKTKKNNGDDIILIKIPKFIEISSNWTKRVKECSPKTPTETPTKLPTEVTTAKEEDKEEDKDVKNNQDLSVLDMVTGEEKISDEKSSFLTKNEIQKEQEEKSRLNQIVLKLTTALFKNGKRFYNLNMFLQSHNRSRIIILIDTLEYIYEHRNGIDNPKRYAESIFKNKNSQIIKEKADAECEKHKGITRERRAEIYG